MSTFSNKKKFLNHPEPLEGPDVPLVREKKSNPVLTGVTLLIAVWLLEHFEWLRRVIWKNTGFSKLRLIRETLEDYEPRYDPTVIPIAAGEHDGNASKAVRELPIAKPTSEQPFRSEYYTSADYHSMYMNGQLTPIAVAKALLPLIQSGASPKDKYSICWHEVQPDKVLAAAEASTLRYIQKAPLGPLDGVPTGVKDDYDMEGYRTNLGSANDYTSKSDGGNGVTSWCVQAVEDLGIMILGRLTMPEFGMDTCGNNPVYGTPTNPYNSQYYTGASSSGSAYAVSVGLVPFALGGDGGGSIRIPASFCLVYGLKPTHNRISGFPSINNANTCGVLGPIAADIRSLATLYQAMATPHHHSHFPPVTPLTLTPSSPKAPEKVLGVPEEWFACATPRTQQLCRAMLDKLTTAYNYKLAPIKIPFLVEGQLAHAMTLLADAAAALQPSVSTITAPNRVLVALGSVTPASDYLLAQKLRHLLMQHLAYLWEKYPGMIIVTPTTSCEGWSIRKPSTEFNHGLSDGDKTLETMVYVWMANFCGVPALTLPVGFAEAAIGPKEDNIPVGMMGMAEWGAEDSLLQFGLDAEALSEEVTRKPPIWLDVVDIARQAMKKQPSGGELRAEASLLD